MEKRDIVIGGLVKNNSYYVAETGIFRVVDFDSNDDYILCIKVVDRLNRIVRKGKARYRLKHSSVTPIGIPELEATRKAECDSAEEKFDFLMSLISPNKVY